MRICCIIIASVLLTGCAAQQAAVSADQQQQLDQRTYTPGPAAALAFDPPVLAGTPRMDLSRDDREQGAFAGYQDSTTTYYDLQLDDKQTGDPSDDRFTREATSETVSTNTR